MIPFPRRTNKTNGTDWVSSRGAARCANWRLALTRTQWNKLLASRRNARTRVSIHCPAFEAAVKITLINPGQLSDAGEDQFAGRIDTVFFRLAPLSTTCFGFR